MFYPFDIQYCKSKVSLLSSVCFQNFNLTTLVVEGDSTDITTYSVYPPRYDYNSSDMSSIYIVHIIVRRFESVLLTTLLPCVILLLLGKMTLLFKHKSFNEKITVTLSLLIVVASIFSQVVATLPSSPEIKFIDIFFFYVILKLGYVFVLHVIVEMVISHDSNKLDTNETSEKNGTNEYLPSIPNSQNALKPIIYESPKKEKVNLLKYLKEAWKPEDTKRKSLETKKHYKCHSLINNIGAVIGVVLDVIFGLISYFFITQARNINIDKYQNLYNSPPSESLEN